MRLFRYLFVLAFLLTVACTEDAVVSNDEETIIRNLPVQDRDFLLEPLEGALDDLRALAESDPRYETQTIRIDTLGWSGQKKIRSNNGDTAMIVLEIHQSTKREQHWRYWDENKELYYLESIITYLDSIGQPMDQFAYKAYFEEGQVLISAYSRTAFAGEKLKGPWRTIEPMPETMQYLMHINKIR
jgi:hypothetical protein